MILLLVEKSKVMHHVFGMQKFPCFLDVHNKFYFFFLSDFALDNRGTEMLKPISLAFILSWIDLILCYSRTATQQGLCHRGSILDIFKA
jgi:hypothetical protein